jgi:hypothetical protein
MTNYSFTVPILPGKTEAWRKHIQEMLGTRREEYNQSRQRLGIRSEQVWLQHTPMGDMCVVSMDTDNPRKVMEGFMTSNDTFDKWFREKVLIECHGMNPSEPAQPPNEQIVNYQGQKTGEKVYSETRKR